MTTREAGTNFLLAIAGFLPIFCGCATQGVVRDEVSALEAQSANLERLEQQLAALTLQLDREEELLRQRQEDVAAARDQALLASDNSRLAEATAAGRLFGETVFRLDGLSFEPGSEALTEESRLLLDQLVERLQVEDAGYFLEVRARSGAEAAPEPAALDQARAEAIRRYLHEVGGLPLHAMSTLAAPEAAALQPPSGPAAPLSAPADGAAAAAASLLAVEPDPVGPIAVVVVRPFPRD
jgi:hypothetical protein